MEAWTFIHKKSKEIIKFDIRSGCIEFGKQYYFTDFEYSPIWFVNSEEEAKGAYLDFVHPQYSMNYNRPSTDKININDYEICKFILTI